MHFVKLRLAGFKSFVDPCELLIEPGLTGIVGPNGCGKSNLVEALRWVMGESSPRQMRGGEMDDVIFGGTAVRPARNLAEVSVLLDNAARTAPAHFNDADELEVVRRIERGSGSAYRVNGREVRARDVMLLFADAVSGAKSTALVGQGHVGDLIGAKPTDRRHLLEEAAGITGLHSRRHEAELKLRAAETNLERLDDVIGALDEQHRGLKRQARQASRYRNISDHIRRAEAILIHWRWRAAEDELVAAANTLDAAERTVAELTGRVATQTTQQIEAGEVLPALRRVEAEAAAALQRLRIAYQGLENEDQQLAAARVQIDQRLAHIAGDTTREAALREDAGEAIGRLAAEAAALHQACAREAQDVDEAAKAHATAAAETEALEAVLTKLTEEVAAGEARAAAVAQRSASLAARRARLVAEAREIEGAKQAGVSAEAMGSALSAARDGSAAAREHLTAARRAREEAETARLDAQAVESRARQSAQAAQAALTTLDSEAAMLRELLAVGDPDLWPPLIDAVAVEPGYELALGIALGDDLSAPTDEAAPVRWQALAPLPDAPALPEGAEVLARFVAAPPALARRLTQIGVVEDEAAGHAVWTRLRQGQRLVSKTGALWRWDGFVASATAPTPAAIRLAKRNRLTELEVERAQAARRVEETRQLVASAQASSAAAIERDGLARAAANQADTALQKARDEEAELARRTAEARTRLAALADTVRRLELEIAEVDKEIADARADGASLVGLDGKRAALGDSRATVAAARHRLSECQTAHERIAGAAAQRHARLGELASESATWQTRADGAALRLAELAQRRAAAETEAERLRALPAQLEARRHELLEQTGHAERRRNQAADTLAQAEARLERIGGELRQHNALLADTREDRVRHQARLAAIEQTLAQLTERCLEKLDCPPERALAAIGLADGEALPELEATETRLDRLVRERDTMGPVNLLAETEADELNRRIDSLNTERADLLAAIARLRQGISGLNREGRERLLRAFDEVNAHFGELFVRLFSGGRAHLALTEADDPLEAGLEIMASPPGKTLQVMSLLSGGEQTLTALALLFAVFLTNPAPVCVLDEVDAALDDSNVDRFCTLVDEIVRSTATRFLLITHHRMTMSRMDRLYGVTMSERGVSQLVSVDLKVAEGLRATA